MHPIEGSGPSLGDLGVDPDDPVQVSDVANCHGCRIEYDDREPSLDPRIVSCADHDLEELRTPLGDAEAAVGTLRRALAVIANVAAHQQARDLATIARVARAALRGEQEESGR